MFTSCNNIDYHYLHDASQLNISHSDPTANRLQSAQAVVFVTIICSYRSSTKSLLTQRLGVHFVSIIQFAHRKNINKCQKIVLCLLTE